MAKVFLPQNFFDFSTVTFRDIFTKVNFVWETLPLIEDYIFSKISKKEKISIGKGTKIAKGATIRKSVVIGKNCYIEEGALIRENCIIGDNVHIGHGVEIKNSIILNESAIAHLNYVGDSIIGNRVNVSGGAIIANFRLDKHSVFVKSVNEKIDTKLKKFGAVVGDDSIIGVNSVLNPGTILGKNCIVYPLTSVTGVHRDNETIK